MYSLHLKIIKCMLMKKLLLLFVLLITVNQLIAQIDMAMELSNLSIEVKKEDLKKMLL